VLRNVFQGAGNWLSIRLVGKGGNRDAIGAVVTARSGGLTQSRLVRSGTSYLSQNDFRLHFGLGKSSKVEVIEVRWPDGSTTRRSAVAANQELTIEKP
jgi:enediyne biosynthesis protein E4